MLAGRDAGYDDLERLPFTRAVVTETLRLYSPVWILPRQAAAEVELGGHRAAGQEQDPVQPVRAQPGSARPP